MTTQNHESMKPLISGLRITRYRDLLKTEEPRANVGSPIRNHNGIRAFP